jgi:hypothetical protein
VGEYTVGTIATMIAVPVLLLAALGTVVAMLVRRRRATESDDRRGYGLAAIGAGVAAVVITGATWWGMYPWRAEYHEWRSVSGVVEFVDSRLLATGDNDGSVEDKFVVIFEGNPQQYGVLDTRAASVRPGDTLTITCVRQYQRSGSHGYDCNFVELVKAPGSSQSAD